MCMPEHYYVDCIRPMAPEFMRETTDVRQSSLDQPAFKWNHLKAGKLIDSIEIEQHAPNWAHAALARFADWIADRVHWLNAAAPAGCPIRPKPKISPLR